MINENKYLPAVRTGYCPYITEDGKRVITTLKSFSRFVSKRILRGDTVISNNMFRTAPRVIAL